jgi:hypothetical protein
VSHLTRTDGPELGREILPADSGGRGDGLGELEHTAAAARFAATASPTYTKSRVWPPSPKIVGRRPFNAVIDVRTSIWAAR